MMLGTIACINVLLLDLNQHNRFSLDTECHHGDLMQFSHPTIWFWDVVAAGQTRELRRSSPQPRPPALLIGSKEGPRSNGVPSAMFCVCHGPTQASHRLQQHLSPLPSIIPSHFEKTQRYVNSCTFDSVLLPILH